MERVPADQRNDHIGFLRFFEQQRPHANRRAADLYLCGYVVKTKIISDEVALTSPFKRKRMFELIIRYIAPICIVAILISSVLSALGVMKI